MYFYLYMYIMIWLLSHPPACPYHFPCPGSNGKAKMHQLYCQWLSCKGQWEKCALVISFKKQHVKDSEELYQFLPRSAIVKEYGEDLADDLIARHKAAEAKLPANQKNQFIKPSLISKYIAFYCSIIFVFANTCKVNMQHPKSESSSLKSTGAAAARNPDFPAREDLFRYKCFTGVTQKNKERVKSEATLEQHAAVEEESYYNTLPFVYS